MEGNKKTSITIGLTGLTRSKLSRSAIKAQRKSQLQIKKRDELLILIGERVGVPRSKLNQFKKLILE